MTRLLLLLVFGYVAYRVIQESSAHGSGVPATPAPRPRSRPASASAARTSRRDG